MTIQERKNLETILQKKLEDALTVKQMNKLTQALWESYAAMDTAAAAVDAGGAGDEHLKAFLQAKRIEGRSEKTLARYEYVIRRFLEAENVPASMVTVLNLRKYYAAEMDRNISGSTVRGYQNVFSSFFGWLWREELIQTNPCNNLAAIKVPKIQRKPYTSVEIEQIKEACEDLRDKAIVCFLLSTGCRIEEVTKLNRSDIDFINKECTVYGKGQKERTVYIDDVAAAALSKYFEARTDDSLALFAGRLSERMTTGGIRSMLKRIEARCGVANIHPHRFRRTLATGLARKGMAIQEIASILGHENVQTTMKYVCVEKASVKHHFQTIVA